MATVSWLQNMKIHINAGWEICIDHNAERKKVVPRNLIRRDS